MSWFSCVCPFHFSLVSPALILAWLSPLRRARLTVVVVLRLFLSPPPSFSPHCLTTFHLLVHLLVLSRLNLTRIRFMVSQGGTGSAWAVEASGCLGGFRVWSACWLWISQISFKREQESICALGLGLWQFAHAGRVLASLNRVLQVCLLSTKRQQQLHQISFHQSCSVWQKSLLGVLLLF